MKKISDAIIVEVQERDPNFTEEAVSVELIKEESFLDHIFDLFFSSFKNISPVQEQRPEPEVAYIVESNEVFIQEIRFASAEILNE